MWFRICEISFGASFNFNTEGRELSALRSSSLIMMTIMMTMVMMMMLWRDSAQDAEHAFQLSGCSCTGSHLILLIIFYLFILFIFSLSAHYIYLYLFFIAHLSRPWSIGWVALSFLSFVRPAMVTSYQISTSTSLRPPNPYIFWKLMIIAIQKWIRNTNTKTKMNTKTKTKTPRK